MSTRELTQAPWPELSSATLTAYTDESGNTGIDLFVKDQPSFFTGTLLTPKDLEATETENLQRMLSASGIDELHATDLKEKGIEPIADELRSLIVRGDCVFVFTEAEKLHFGLLKLADCLLDSGNNHALLPLHYYVKPLKNVLVASLGVAIQQRPDLLKQFWDGYTKKREKPFVDALLSLREQALAVVEFPRNRELLLDAIDWATKNPSAVMDSVNAAFDSPNVVGVVQVVHCLHQIVGKRDMKVSRFVHDRQSQFAPAIMQMYKSMASLAPKTVLPMLTTPVEWERSKSLVDVMEISAAPLVGLQVVDVALWLFKRAASGQLPSMPGCWRLLREVVSRCVSREMTLSQFVRETNEDYLELMAKPLTPEMEARGRALQEDFELKRQARRDGK